MILVQSSLEKKYCHLSEQMAVGFNRRCLGQVTGSYRRTAKSAKGVVETPEEYRGVDTILTYYRACVNAYLAQDLVPTGKVKNRRH